MRDGAPSRLGSNDRFARRSSRSSRRRPDARICALRARSGGGGTRWLVMTRPSLNATTNPRNELEYSRLISPAKSVTAGSASMAPVSAAMATASSAADRLGNRSGIRPVIQRNTTPCIARRVASKVTNPNAILKYRLRYQMGSDIGELVPRAPDGEDQLRIPRVGFDLLANPLDERVDAAFGHVRVDAPDALE